MHVPPGRARVAVARLNDAVSDPLRQLSIVIPTLNEAAGIESLLVSLQGLRQRGHEIVLVDGGSADATPALAARYVDQVLRTVPGRATQMRAGAAAAHGDVFWFLHADSRIEPDADVHILAGMTGTDLYWGRFDIRFDDTRALLRLVGWCMNWRSRLTGIATGDQGIFVSRVLYDRVGGFADIPLMEDIALSRSLRAHVRPMCLHTGLQTSARRWRKHGVTRTILLMWYLRLLYFLGAPPERLLRYYRLADS